MKSYFDGDVAIKFKDQKNPVALAIAYEHFSYMPDNCAVVISNDWLKRAFPFWSPGFSRSLARTLKEIGLLDIGTGENRGLTKKTERFDKFMKN